MGLPALDGAQASGPLGLEPRDQRVESGRLVEEGGVAERGEIGAGERSGDRGELVEAGLPVRGTAVVREALGGVLGGALGGMLAGALGGALAGMLAGALGGMLAGALGGALGPAAPDFERRVRLAPGAYGDHPRG